MASPSEQTARTAALFDAVSLTYDDVGVDFFRPIAAGLLDHLAPRPGERVLDVGCGRGAVTIPAAQQVGAEGRVLGVDLSPEMVRLTREAATAAGLTNVQVEVADAQSPEVPDGPFDVIASSLVLFFLPDPAAALAAWHDLLVPGGRLGITTFGPMDERWRHVDDVFTPHLPPAMRDARTSGGAGPFASDEGMDRLVGDAGYAEVRSVPATVAVRFASVEQWHDFTWSTGQRAMWLSVPEAERPQVRAEAERRVAAHAATDGSITFDQPVRHTLARRPA